MGKAIVASEVGGLCEFLTDNVTARLFPPGSASALAARCTEVLADVALRRRLGEAARALVQERYNWRTIAAAYGEIYGHLAR